jgi:hypothetical protein
MWEPVEEHSESGKFPLIIPSRTTMRRK